MDEVTRGTDSTDVEGMQQSVLSSNQLSVSHQEVLKNIISTGVLPPAEVASRIAAMQEVADGADEEKVAVATAHQYFADAIGVLRQAVLNAGPGQQEAVARRVIPVLEHLDAMVGRLIVDSVNKIRETQLKQDEAKRSLASALLAGESAADLAGRLGITLAQRYAILICRVVGPLPTEERPQFVNRVTQVSTYLEDEPEVLYVLDRDGWTVLIAGRQGSDALLREHAAVVTAAIEARSGVKVAAGGAIASAPDKIPAALAEAKRIASLAGRLARHSQMFWIEDFALEYQLDQPGPANNWLRGVLAPLRGQNHLLQSLDAFVGNNFHRAEAAAALNIHRNSLNYRLSRIASLTGYDPTVPADARILSAALTVVQLTVERRAAEREKGRQAPPPMPRTER
ncbi:MAG: PucR family transcriptional regulator [Mycobacteriaceae bacterium]